MWACIINILHEDMLSSTSAVHLPTAKGARLLHLSKEASACLDAGDFRCAERASNCIHSGFTGKMRKLVLLCSEPAFAAERTSLKQTYRALTGCLKQSNCSQQEDNIIKILSRA